ncbi:MAG TPA: hypothetical protein VEP90_17770 [Methylomirabilota bacterium]|nr:hypothetical protein [Methylomirabilota bacterium]
MGLLDGLKKAAGTAIEQLTSSSPKPQSIYFTTNFQQKAKAWEYPRKTPWMCFITERRSNQG